jgi:hypothetical protein
MRRLLPLFLLLSLALAALPPLLGPALPPGTELRLLSQDLRTLHGAWRVEGKTLKPLSRPFPPSPGRRSSSSSSCPAKGPGPSPPWRTGGMCSSFWKRSG